MRKRLLQIHDLLDVRYGPLHWWPAETPFEMAVGAVLTQNTAWTNVEKAIGNLQGVGVLEVRALAGLAREELERLIRPSGFFRQKAERLQLLASHLLDRHGGELLALLDGDMEAVRQELLGLKGIGPETADSILLYAGGHPSFVVDAYTRRLFSRLGLLEGGESYEEIRAWFMEHLPCDVALFNEYHALIVEQCKNHCRKKPRCGGCPLAGGCSAAGVVE